MPKEYSAEEAAEMAIEAARKAAESIEASRVAQMEASDARHLKMLTEALGNIFGNESDNKDPEHMKVLIRRVPILCTNIENMHQSIEKMQDNLTWIVRLIIGAVILALIALLTK